jgi:transposase InsO family protein
MPQSRPSSAVATSNSLRAALLDNTEGRLGGLERHVVGHYRLGEAGVRASMGSVGDAYDNAMAESFFSTLEAELLNRRRFASQAEAKIACFSYIEGWYNPVRLHSGLGYRSPVTYEADMQAIMTKT